MPSRPIAPVSIALVLSLMAGAPPCLAFQEETPDPPEAPEATEPPAAAASAVARIPWSEIPAEEDKVLGRMLESSDWTFRAVGLMRLDRYAGDAVDAHVRRLVADDAWQVRCFAASLAHAQGVEIDPETLAEETEPRVVRAALRFGVPVPAETVDVMARQLLNINTIDSLLLGIELAAGSEDAALRAEGGRRTVILMRNMNSQVASVISPRLAAILQLNPAPRDLAEWGQWMASQRGKLVLPRPAPVDPKVHSDISSMDSEAFVRLKDYLGVLRQRDLEIAIVMDCTASMRPMIEQVKTDVDALVLFLGDISATLRLGIVAYRDHDNVGRLLESHPFTTDIESLRNFLFNLKTPGGSTYAEAVLDGVRATTTAIWNPQAERQIIVIGDAPPHDADRSTLRGLLDYIRSEGLTVNAVHVPMQWPPGYLQQMTRPQAMERERFRGEYNRSTRDVFAEIAQFGGGRLVELDTAARSDLVRSIMKLTIHQEWWPQFDSFYDAYLILCR